jgi:hypothetical protein
MWKDFRMIYFESLLHKSWGRVVDHAWANERPNMLNIPMSRHYQLHIQQYTFLKAQEFSTSHFTHRSSIGKLWKWLYCSATCGCGVLPALFVPLEPCSERRTNLTSRHHATFHTGNSTNSRSNCPVDETDRRCSSQRPAWHDSAFRPASDFPNSPQHADAITELEIKALDPLTAIGHPMDTRSLLGPVTTRLAAVPAAILDPLHMPFLRKTRNDIYPSYTRHQEAVPRLSYVDAFERLAATLHVIDAPHFA